MSAFDSVTVRVVVRNGDFVGMGSIVHDETAVLPLTDEQISLDVLYRFAPAFFYERLEMYDGYGVAVEGRAIAQWRGRNIGASRPQARLRTHKCGLRWTRRSVRKVPGGKAKVTV
jgi:hypothetical protein